MTLIAKPFTIGDLKRTLAAYGLQTPVDYNYGGRPLGYHSWRGSYDCPAIGETFSHGETSVKRLLEMLGCLTTEEFQGWKGGEFRYTDSDVLYVDNEGIYTGRFTIYRVSYKDGSVVLHIQRED